MKQQVVLLILLSIPILSQAQLIKKFEFIGTLQLDNQELITYQINFTTDSASNLKGVSCSDIYGNDRTSTNINGIFDLKKKLLSFSELSNVSTKSKADIQSFCFITVTNAKIKRIQGKTIIQGRFIGKFKDGKSCANGNIYLMSRTDLDDLTEQVIKKQHKDSIEALRTRANTLKIKTDKNILKSNEQLQLAWSSKDIIIEIWDGEQEDADEIELTVNDKKVLDKLVIRKEKKILIIPCSKGTNTIIVKGVSEGINAPCTANILLRDQLHVTNVVAVLKKGEQTIITIELEQ